MTSLDNGFWWALHELVARSQVVIDRPRGAVHPRDPSMRYEVDYGCLDGKQAMDGGGVDLWRGSDPAGPLDAVVCTVDLAKGDTEVKLPIACTAEDKHVVVFLRNDSMHMKGLWVRR